MSRPALKTALGRLGLMPALRRARELWLTARFYRANRAFLKANGVPDGLPLPPARLRILVAASPDIAWFLEAGRRGAQSVRGILERNGISIEAQGPVLDFGCGCSRVLRNFIGEGIPLSGSDLNHQLVAWCRIHLRGARFETNGLSPPLPFKGGEFGVVYSLSVFTHLPETLQRPWMDELVRVLRPGGHLIFSTHGAHYADQLTREERVRFDSGDLIVRHDERPGSNACGAYHPEAYVRNHLPVGVKVVDHIPEGALGNPYQDLWLLRKT